MDVTRPYAEGTRVECVDLSRLRLHEVSLEGTRVTDAVLTGAALDGDIAGLRVHGVKIAPLIEAELDRRHPQRILLQAGDLPSLREGWALLERDWSALTERAGDLGDKRERTSADGEWSLVQTLRHLIFATDCWLRRAVLAVERTVPASPGHPTGTRPVLRCLHVLLREEWSHLRYATRDLDLLDPTRPVAP